MLGLNIREARIIANFNKLVHIIELGDLEVSLNNIEMSMEKLASFIDKGGTKYTRRFLLKSRFLLNSRFLLKNRFLLKSGFLLAL